MKKILVYISILILAQGCGNEKSEKVQGEKSDSLDYVETDGNIESLENEESIIFWDFLYSLSDSEDLENDIYFLQDVLMIEFENITTAQELYDFYFGTFQVGLETLNDIMYAYDEYPEGNYEGWASLSEVMPYYSADLFCSECSFEVVIDAYPFYELAKKTPSKDDDDYFLALHLFNNGDEEVESLGYIPVNAGNNYTFQSFSCDFCTENLLGTGIYYEVLKSTQNCMDTTHIFHAELYDLAKKTVGYMNDNCFQVEQDDVVAELEKIAMDIVLPEELMNQVYKEIDAISNGKNINFADDCENDY